MPALGTTVERDRRERLSRFEYYLRLADALFNRADDSGHLRQLGHSFGHDVLNLATLAGRLLWYEGVTPDMWRSHDLVAVGVDAETYLVCPTAMVMVSLSRRRIVGQGCFKESSDCFPMAWPLISSGGNFSGRERPSIAQDRSGS